MEQASNGLATIIAGLRQTIENLRAEIQGWRGEADFLREYGEQTRSMVWRQRIGFLVVALLSVLSVYTSQVARHAQSLAKKNQERAYTTCLAGNDFRAKEKRLWEKVFSFTPLQVQTPQQKAQYEAQKADFQKFLNDFLASRDCKNL